MTGAAMDVEYAFLCDAATEHGGKINALGIGIDHLGVGTLPVTHPRLTLVARLRFEDARDLADGEAGDADAGVPFTVRVVDADGRDVMPEVAGRFAVQAAPGRRLQGANLLVDLVALRFTAIGPHEVQLASGGTVVATLPLEVWKVAAA